MSLRTSPLHQEIPPPSEPILCLAEDHEAPPGGPTGEEDERGPSTDSNNPADSLEQFRRMLQGLPREELEVAAPRQRTAANLQQMYGRWLVRPPVDPRKTLDARDIPFESRPFVDPPLDVK